MQNPQKLLYFVIATVFTFLLVIVAFLTSTRSFQKSNLDDNFNEEVTEATPFPENETEIRYVGAGCKTSGCSGQLCIDASEEDVITTCEYKDEYACYKTAICEKQENRSCGWRDTPELKSCLESPSTPIPSSTEPYL